MPAMTKPYESYKIRRETYLKLKALAKRQRRSLLTILDIVVDAYLESR